MREDFPRAMAAVLVYEGGYSNHPRDPGGVTLEGIIQRVYDGYRRRKGLAVRPLTPSLRGTPDWIAERDEIYRTQYWNAVRADELPAGVDIVLMDCAVNSGPYQAAMWLQRALRLNDCDGHIGEGTLMAALSHPDHDALIADILGRRLGMLHNLQTWDAFDAGWTRRVESVKAIGQHYAMGSVGPAGQGIADFAPEPVAAHELGGQAKAYASDIDEPAVSQGAGMVATGSSSGLAAMLQLAKEQIAPYVYSSRALMNIFLALTMICIAVAVVGAIVTWWSNRKATRARAAINGEIVAQFDSGGAPLPAPAG